MSLILCLETATEVCSVAIAQNGVTLCSESVQQGNSHAAQLQILVQNCLQKTGYTLKNLDAIAISKGPGSYTGLRVGTSAAKGYCYGLDIPLIAIDSLSSLCNLLLQKQKPEPNILLAPMIDARRMEVYTAVLDQELHVLEPISAKIITETSFLELLTNNQVLFFGNGSAKCKTSITHPNAIFSDHLNCHAEGLCSLAERAFVKKIFENSAYFEPYYLKDFVGTQAKKLAKTGI